MRATTVYRTSRAVQSTSKLAAILRRRMKQREEERAFPKSSNVGIENKLESMIASAFLRDNASSFESYQRYTAHAKELETAQLDEALRQSKAGQLFPYNSENLAKFSLTADGKQPEGEPAVVQGDRGFFVKGDTYCDEYTEGTTTSIPEDEQNEFQYLLGGSKDAVELIEFRDPHQANVKNESVPTGLKEDFELFDQDWKMEYGREDPNYKLESKISCSGCGAKLHCHDSALPGFVPVELLEKIIKTHRHNKREQINDLCRRCYMIKKHEFLLNVNVSAVNYTALMGHLKYMQEALILLVIDMTDIRGSIHKQLPDIIGDKKPMIVIGNKVDLLPPDAKPGYLKRFRNLLRSELEAAGFLERFNVLDIALVSAKTGYNVEDLISLIYVNWLQIKGALRGDIYVVGCTNAGKSTLFNAFLQSDLCKVRAIDLVERVTTSIWPGTTLSLLKFPVMTPTARRLEMRKRRLLANTAWVHRETHFQHQLFKETRDPKYLTMIGKVESTFKESEQENQPLKKEEAEQLFDGDDISESLARKTRTLKLDAKEFVNGNWCFDTPGTVNTNQILDLLTLDELIRVIPRTMIVPRTFVCNIGESLLIGGLARIDVGHIFLNDNQKDTYGIRSVYLTVFVSKHLPINLMPTKQVPKFVSERLGTEILGAPLGDSERLSALPGMQSENFMIFAKSRSVLQGSKDILLSSIGWVLVSTQYNAKFEVYTPGGRGIGLRDPLLPHAAQMKGNRIPGTSEYVPKIRVPEPEKPKKRRSK